MAPRLAFDVLSGATTSILVAITGLIATPLYLALLGQESYGVIAFYTALSSVVVVMDLGLPITLNRAVAQSLTKVSSKDELGTIVWGAVGIFWVQAVLIVAVSGICSWWVATTWLHPGSLSDTYLQQSVLLAGVALGVRWPISIYQAVLMGANRIVLVNGATVASTLLTTVGALVTLHWVTPDLRAMFGWYVCAGVVNVAWLHACAFSVTPKPRLFTYLAAHRLKKFVLASAPVAVTGIIGLLLTQSDKVILSRLVTLDAFGHYMLATLVASAIYATVTPLSNALYPRFSALAVRGNLEELRKLYRNSCHGLAAMLFPVSMLLCVFGEDIVLLWTRNEDVAAAVAPLLRFLVLGSALHGIMFVTYAVSMAMEMQKLVLVLNVVILAFALPLTWFCARFWGAEGTAVAWLVLHAAYFLSSAVLTHRRVLPGLSWRWLWFDIGIPAGISVVAGSLASWGMAKMGESPPLRVAHGVAIVLICWGCMLVASQRLRVLCRLVAR